MIRDVLNELKGKYFEILDEKRAQTEIRQISDSSEKKNDEKSMETIKDLSNTLCEQRIGDGFGNNVDMTTRSITCQAECLLQGVKAKTYKPLLKRITCSSLEERIDHYVKKRRLEQK